MTQAEDQTRRSFLVTLVVLTFAMNLIARGVPETFAVFLLPVQKGLGVSRADITLTYSVYMLAYGLSGPFAGQLIDRLGARVAYAFGLRASACGYLLAGFATELWHYLVTVGLLGGLGAACARHDRGLALCSARWFTSRIGSIMSLPYAAIGAGMLILPPLTQVLISLYDWRTAHMILGAGVLMALPLVMLLPLGRMTAGLRGVALAAHRHRGQRGRALDDLGGPAHQRLLGPVCRLSLHLGGSLQRVPHSVAYLVERGFDPLVAASAFGFAGMLSAIGIVSRRLGVGPLRPLGRRPCSPMSSPSSASSSLSLVSLWPSLALVYAFVFFFGLMQGARGPIIVAMIAVLFPGGVGAIYGTLSVAQGVGAGFGSWLSGYLYEVTGGYIVSFMLAICGSLAGLSTFWVVRSLREEKIASATAPPDPLSPLAGRGPG